MSSLLATNPNAMHNQMKGGYGQGSTGIGSRQHRTGNQESNFDLGSEKQRLLEQLFGLAGPEGKLGKLAAGDQSQFAEMEAPALQQFAGMQGNLASRFAGMGGLGGARGSGFQNAMSKSSSDFAQQLQSNRMNLQRQALMDLMGMQKELLSTPQRTKRSFWEQLIGAGLPILGAVGGSFIPGLGPMGGALGGKLGSLLSSAITGEESAPMDWASIAQLPTSWGGSSSGSNVQRSPGFNVENAMKYMRM